MTNSLIVCVEVNYSSDLQLWAPVAFSSIHGKATPRAFTLLFAVSGLSLSRMTTLV